jgi:hypothetical protein
LSSTASFAGRAPYEIEIGKQDTVLQGMTVDVPIILKKSANRIIEYNFKIAYDADILTPEKIIPGSFFSQCDWEQFKFDIWPVDSLGAEYPSGILTISGLASSDNEKNPKCCGPETGDTLGLITFFVSKDFDYSCTHHPVRFFWTECNDNSLVAQNDHKILFSRDVINSDGSIIDDSNHLPGFTGTPDSCLKTISSDRDQLPMRAINFINGSIDIICTIDICDFDLNLNGISNELSDWLIYYDYHVKCPDIFHPRPILYPSTEDYIWSLICAQPDCVQIPDESEVYDGVLTIEERNGEMLIHSKFDIYAGAIHLVFDVSGASIDHIIPGHFREEIIFTYDLCNDTLRIILASNHASCTKLPRHKIDILTIQFSNAKPNLVSAWAVGFNGEEINLYLDLLTDGDEIRNLDIPEKYSLSYNYPNPFNPATTVMYSLPTRSRVEISVYNVWGQKVVDLVDEIKPAGQYQITWDGNDSYGNQVASGIYFARLKANDYIKSRKMLMVK